MTHQRPADLDLRITAGARLTCDLSARVGEINADLSRDRVGSSAAVIPGAPTTGPWMRALWYVAFAIAIALPWVLLLVDQIVP